MPSDAPTIWRLADLLASPEARRLPAEMVREIARVGADHQIEIFERPSPNPGVEGGGRGASPKQLAFQRAFFSRKYRIHAISGANQCLGPETMISSPDGDIPVGKIDDYHQVFSWNGVKQVKSRAGMPWVKGIEECFRLTFTNGQWIDCSRGHRMLTNLGWISAGELMDVTFGVKGVVPPLVGVNGEDVKIVTIEAKGLEQIYDFNVPMWHNYVAAGIVHHNSGKTQTVGGLCFAKHIRDYAVDGDVYWVIAQTHDTIRDIPQRTLWQFLPHSMFPEGLTYRPRVGFGLIPTLQLTLPDDRGKCEVWFRSEEVGIKVLESARLNGIWWSECRNEAIWDALQPRLAAKKGWMLMDYVPTEAWHKFRVRLVAEAGDPDIYHDRLCMKDNAHNLPVGEIAFQRRRMTADEAAVRIDGVERAAFGVVFREFIPAKHVCEPFEIPKELSLLTGVAVVPRWRGLDYGYRHFTVCLWAAMMPMGWVTPWGEKLAEDTLFFYREMFARERTVLVNAQEILDMSRGEKYVENEVVVDPSMYNITQANGVSIAVEYESAGLACRPGIRTSSVGEPALIARMRKWFEADKIRFFNTLPQSIRQFQSWRYKQNKEGMALGNEAFEDKDNDAIDAAKYLIAEEPTFHQYKVEITNVASV